MPLQLPQCSVRATIRLVNLVKNDLWVTIRLHHVAKIKITLRYAKIANLVLCRASLLEIGASFSKRIPAATERNTMFVHLLVWDERYSNQFLGELLAAVFDITTYCQYVILVIPPRVTAGTR